MCFGPRTHASQGGGGGGLGMRLAQNLSIMFLLSNIFSSIAPEAPGGSKYERNLPPPPHVSIEVLLASRILNSFVRNPRTPPGERQSGEQS